jgi:SpoVK/Ycf46/Vps4 family AAA+-type ATPase
MSGNTALVTSYAALRGGADLEYLCKEAAMKCLRRLLPELNLEDEKVP